MSKKRKRVLLTLDCDTLDTDALSVLTVLADKKGLEITGLYVEDEELLNAARLPGLREISHVTGTVTQLSADRISQQIASQGQRARLHFEASTRRLPYKASFVVARGRAVDTLTAAALKSDIVVITRSRRASGMRTRSGSHFEPLMSMHKNILFVNEPWASGDCIIALYEPSRVDHISALRTARRFADAEQLDLLVAVPREHAVKLPVDTDRIVTLENWSEGTIAQLCERENARLLVLSRSEHLDWRTLLVYLVDRLPCSLLRLEE